MGALTESRRDLLAGALMIVAGAGIVREATRYGLGTLERMGAGLFPSLLGGVLVLVGALIVVTRNSAHAEDHDPALHMAPDWRGWACILGGVLLFIVLGEEIGLGPGTFACVFVSALGDRRSTWLSALVLALVATAFAAIVFTGLLHFQLPFVRW